MKRDINILKAKEINNQQKANQKLLVIVIGFLLLIAFLGLGAFLFKLSSDLTEVKRKHEISKRELSAVRKRAEDTSKAKIIEAEIKEISDKKDSLKSVAPEYIKNSGTLSFGVIDLVVFEPNGKKNKENNQSEDLTKENNGRNSYLRVEKISESVSDTGTTLTANVKFYYKKQVKDKIIKISDEKEVVNKYIEYLKNNVFEIIKKEIKKENEEEFDFEIKDKMILFDKKNQKIVLSINNFWEKLSGASQAEEKDKDNSSLGSQQGEEEKKFEYYQSKLDVEINKDYYSKVVKALEEGYKK